MSNVDEIVAEEVAVMDAPIGEVLHNEDGKIDIVLPEKWNVTALQSIANELRDKTHVRGVQTFLDRIERYGYHISLCESVWEQLEASVRFLSGTRLSSDVPRQMKPETVAHRFYNTLNTTALRQHCSLFGLTFDDYESIEDVVNALVEEQVSMISTQ